jgi:hypothetical protein
MRSGSASLGWQWWVSGRAWNSHVSHVSHVSHLSTCPLLLLPAAAAAAAAGWPRRHAGSRGNRTADCLHRQVGSFPRQVLFCPLVVTWQFVPPASSTPQSASACCGGHSRLSSKTSFNLGSGVLTCAPCTDPAACSGPGFCLSSEADV